MRGKIKKFTAVVLALILVLAGGSHFGLTAVASASVGLSASNLTGAPLSVGSTFNVPVIITNSGTSSAAITSISASGSGVNQINNPSVAGSIAPGGSDTPSFDFEITPSAINGTNSITISLNYLDGTQQRSTSTSVTFNVFNPANDPNTGQPPPPPPTPPPVPEVVGAPNIRLITPQTVTLNAGETVELTLQVRNIGSQSAHGLLTQANVPTASPFTAEFLRNTNSVTSVGGNATRNMTLSITADDNAESGSHTLTLTHFFRNSEGANLPSSTDTITVRIIGEEVETGEPIMNINNFRTIQAQPLSPGQTFTATANINNRGNMNATNVQVSLPNMDANTIFFTGDLNQVFFNTIEPSASNNLQFTFQTSNNIQSGTYPIDVQVTYRDQDGRNQQTETFRFFVNVYAPEEEEELTNIEIINMTAPTGRLNPGQTGNISFQLVNSGEAELRNVVVQAFPESGIVPMTADTIVVPLLRPGQTFDLSFSFMPTETAGNHSHTIRFNVNTGELSFNRFSSINVFNPTIEDDDPPDSGRFQIPRVIVSEYSTNPIIPRAGHEFDMDITFRNTNTHTSVNNVRITLEPVETVQGHGTVFTPVGGSNTVFIDYMPPNGEVTKNLRFFTVPEADPRSYTLQIVFDYQDDEMRTHNATELLSISVAQITRLEAIWMREIPAHASVGDMIFFEFRATNTGRVDLMNVRVRTDGPWDMSEASMFIGPLRAQSAMSFSGRFTPWEEGVFDGAVVVYGEDATGAIVEYIHEFTLNVSGGFMGGDFGGAWGDDGDFDFGGRNPMQDGFFNEQGEWIQTGYWNEYGEWVQLGEWNEFGEWVSFDEDSGGFLDFISRPIVWIPVAIVVVLAVVVTIVMIHRKRMKLDFDEDTQDK